MCIRDRKGPARTFGLAFEENHIAFNEVALVMRSGDMFLESRLRSETQDASGLQRLGEQVRKSGLFKPYLRLPALGQAPNELFYSPARCFCRSLGLGRRLCQGYRRKIRQEQPDEEQCRQSQRPVIGALPKSHKN